MRKVTVSSKIDPKLVQRVDAWAEHMMRTRSSMLVLIISLGLDALDKQRLFTKPPETECSPDES